MKNNAYILDKTKTALIILLIVSAVYLLTKAVFFEPGSMLDSVRNLFAAPVGELADTETAELSLPHALPAYIAVSTGDSLHYAEKYDYNLFLPEPDTALRVQECIELVKAGRKEEAGRRLTEIVLALWQEKDLPIMAACTELPLAYDASGLPPERTVSSLAALANGCLDRIYN